MQIEPSINQTENLNSFYTRTSIGALFANVIGDISPENILDLGAGEGSLSYATSKRWPTAKCVTVDIDTTINASLAYGFSSNQTPHSHYVLDVLDPELPHHLRKEGAFDLAVCNPPFYKPKLTREHQMILDGAGLTEACPSAFDNSAEVLFLGQNLRLLKHGGTVALIVPDGLMTGYRSRSFRRIILKNHKLECVLQLPNHSFHNTEARCFILVLKKNMGPTNEVRLMRYTDGIGTSEPLQISPEEAENRMDYDYHATSLVPFQNTIRLRELGADVRRGSFSTVERRSGSMPIFHTTDFRSPKDGILNITSSKIPDNPKVIIAGPGDIIMARVDRSLHQKVAIVRTGKIALTDCVYRIRLPLRDQNVAFKALRSDAGKSTLLAATKGVGARLIGKADLLDLSLPVST